MKAKEKIELLEKKLDEAMWIVLYSMPLDRNPAVHLTTLEEYSREWQEARKKFLEWKTDYDN